MQVFVYYRDIDNDGFVFNDVDVILEQEKAVLLVSNKIGMISLERRRVERLETNHEPSEQGIVDDKREGWSRIPNGRLFK